MLLSVFWLLVWWVCKSDKSMRREWRKGRSERLRGRWRRIFDSSASHALPCSGDMYGLHGVRKVLSIILEISVGQCNKRADLNVHIMSSRCTSSFWYPCQILHSNLIEPRLWHSSEIYLVRFCFPRGPTVRDHVIMLKAKTLNNNNQAVKSADYARFR